MTGIAGDGQLMHSSTFLHTGRANHTQLTDCGRYKTTTSPAWPHVPRKFTRLSHLRFAVARDCLFSSSGNNARVGSVPIARATSRLASGPVGTRDWCQHVDPVGKRWEPTSIWRRSRVLSYPQVAPPFTRTVTRGDFKNSLCDSHTIRQRSRLAGIDPTGVTWPRPLAAVGWRAADS
jgi:hypothetical protein